MIDLGTMTDKFSESGQNVLRRAIELSKNCDHNFLSLSHIFVALTEFESALFAETMQAVGLDHNTVKSRLYEELSGIQQHPGRKVGIPEPTRDLFNRAMRRARGQGRQQVESYDLFATLFAGLDGAPAEMLRRLGVDPAMATEAISQFVRPREQQTLDASLRHIPQLQRVITRGGQTTPFTLSKRNPIFKFSQLTSDLLNYIATVEEKGVTPDIWDEMKLSLTEEERRQVEVVVSSFLNSPVLRMNESTIWSRTIYPMLVLAEQGGLEAWAQMSLKAQFSQFALEGLADGVVGHNLSGLEKSYCLVVVQVKREAEAQDPLIRLYGTMLAAARLNWEMDNQGVQELYGCYTIADSWIFAHGLVTDIEAQRPTMTVSLSRAYSETVEAGTVLRILKSITGKYAQELADAA